MSRSPIRFLTLAAAGLAGVLMVPAAAQTLGITVFNTKREHYSGMWAGGSWAAYCMAEDMQSLNGDRDMDDDILCVVDMRNGSVQVTGLAIADDLVDDDEDVAVAVSDDWIALQVSETDQGGVDLNGNESPKDNILALFKPSSRQVVSLGLIGHNPTFHAGRLYFGRPESDAKMDLNGDGDTLDTVLCACDPATKKVESLNMEATRGFVAAGDWIAALTSEAAQAGKDLNGDGDNRDLVVQVYQVSQRRWTNTALEGSSWYELTPRALAVAVTEQLQGDQDLNGDKDKKDVVCMVRDLTRGENFNTARDCSGGLSAHEGLVGILCSEAAQANTDLNGDRDTTDEIGQVYDVATQKVTNLGRDASGGLLVEAGKVAFVCSEEDQGKRDLNGDRDTEDYVLLIYDPAQNRVLDANQSVDGDLTSGEGLLAWRVLESDQFNRDLNRDGDTDDSILCLMDLATGAWALSNTAAADSMALTRRGVAFVTPELDQGDRDLNGDRETDDDIVQLALIRGR